MPLSMPMGAPSAGPGLPIASPVAAPPSPGGGMPQQPNPMMAMAGPLASLVQGNPAAAVVTTNLIESLTKLIKTMTTVGERKDKMTRVSPFGPQQAAGDQIAMRQAVPPPALAVMGGGRPPGMY